MRAAVSRAFENLSNAFKRTAAVAVLAFSPLAIPSAEAIAPVATAGSVEQRYTRLELVMKSARKDCAFLDKLDAAEDKTRKKADNILDIVERISLGKSFTRHAKNAGLGVCFINPDQSPNKSMPLHAAYLPDLGIIAFNKNIDPAEIIEASIHEFEHFMQDFRGFMEYSKMPQSPDEKRPYLTFDDELERTFELELDAYVLQVLGSWMLNEKKFVNGQPFPNALKFTTGQEQAKRRADRMSLEMNLAAAQGHLTGGTSRSSAGTLSVHESPETAGMRAAVKMLNKVAKENPEWIENGNAAKLVYDCLKNDGRIQRVYLEKTLKEQAMTMSHLIVWMAAEHPDWFESGKATVAMTQLLEMRKVSQDITLLSKIAGDFVKSGGKLALQIAQKRPEDLINGQAADAVFQNLSLKGVVDQFRHKISEARSKQGPNTPEKIETENRQVLSNLGSIHYKGDYRYFSLEKPR